jgi:hypothetical protein
MYALTHRALPPGLDIEEGATYLVREPRDPLRHRATSQRMHQVQKCRAKQAVVQYPDACDVNNSLASIADPFYGRIHSRVRPKLEMRVRSCASK